VAFESTWTSSYLVYAGSLSFDEIVYLAVDLLHQSDFCAGFHSQGEGPLDHF